MVLDIQGCDRMERRLPVVVSSSSSLLHTYIDVDDRPNELLDSFFGNSRRFDRDTFCASYLYPTCFGTQDSRNKRAPIE